MVNYWLFLDPLVFVHQSPHHSVLMICKLYSPTHRFLHRPGKMEICFGFQSHGYQLSFYYFEVPAIEYNFHHIVFNSSGIPEQIGQTQFFCVKQQQIFLSHAHALFELGIQSNQHPVAIFW